MICDEKTETQNIQYYLTSVTNIKVIELILNNNS